MITALLIFFGAMAVALIALSAYGAGRNRGQEEMYVKCVAVLEPIVKKTEEAAAMAERLAEQKEPAPWN